MKRFNRILSVAFCIAILTTVISGVTVSAEEPQVKAREVYLPETLIVNPPAVVQKVDSAAKLSKLQEIVRPQGAWLRVNPGDHTVVLSDGNVALTAALDACDGKVVPIVETPDPEAARFVFSTVKDAYYDLIIASADAEALKIFQTQPIAGIRLAYISEESDPAKLVRDALGCGAMIVVQSQTTRANAEYLQQRFLTVMLRPDADNDELAVRAAIDAGANFIVSDGFTKAYEMYESVQRVAYIRRAYIVGHRCMVTNAPENTVEGLHEAFQNGADAVEIDIWRTEDDRLVCFHNNYLKGCTTVEAEDPEKLINSYTYDQLQEFTLKPKGNYENCKIPTLDQMLAALKEYPGKILVIEIKDYKKTGALVHQLIEQYDVADQCVFISFGRNYLTDQLENNPGLGCSLLDSGYPLDPSGCVDRYYTISAGQCVSYSPSQAISYDAIRQLQVRGISVNLWTAQTLGQMSTMAYHGAQFITTDSVTDGSSILSYYNPNRMSAKSVFGTYIPPAAQTPDRLPDLVWIAIAGIGLIGIVAGLTVIALKRRKK